MKKKYLLLFSILFVSVSIFGQSKEDIQKITAEYDMVKLKEKEAFYKKNAIEEKAKAIATAKANNWPIYTAKEDGSISELMKLSPSGFPIYYTTDNVNAARSTRANHLHTGGSLGLNLNGQGMTVREWDGGNVRASHNAFGGRVTVVDDASATTVLHATHVCGTLIAAASPAAVKGMAWQANARTFNWTNDASEALSEVQEGMLISNHSYGTPITSNGTTLPSSFIGSYTGDAAAWDDIAYNAPYYLPVMSAGNDGQNENNPEPLAFGFDKLVGNKTAKNNLIVASCEDVTVAADGTVNPANIAISSFSSEGPTDDFRVKPDITGNGSNLTSTINTSNTATGPQSGTSMASPNVAGTLVLVQQHYKNLTNSFMRAATLKGLACHTADDAGDVGPDPIFGWGLLNGKKAVETITNNGLTSWVSEENLNNNQVFTMTVNSPGGVPLIGSITWTDVPGKSRNLLANDPTPALVNDLDIRITRNGTTYYPWKLNSDPNSPALRTEDNAIDNVEQVKIDAPAAGQYTITISHKGSLVTGSQKYSLIITGLSSTFAINSTSDNLTLCSNQNAAYTFNYTQTPTSSGTTTFSAVDLPAGATASFSPASLNANGVVTMTISGLSNVIPNEYFVGIKGTSSTDTETRYKSLRVYSSTFQPVVAQSPTQGQQAISTTANLIWVDQPNAEFYRVQVSASPLFTTLLANESLTENQYQVSGLLQATRYYWRVIPSNFCGNSTEANATTYTFATGTLACNNTYTATDFSNATIGTLPNSEATVPVTVTGGFTIGDINVNMNITHTWIGDITISLEGPAAIGSPIITLLDIPCGDNKNINCTMDDDGAMPACSGIPAITGNIIPVDPLSSLNTLPADGVWILRVLDHNNEDGGVINSFSINLCRVQSALSVDDNPILKSTVYPNPTKGIVNVEIPGLTETATIKLFDLQGRQILSKETNQVSTSFGIESLQDGIYLVNIENEQGSLSKKIILRR